MSDNTEHTDPDTASGGAPEPPEKSQPETGRPDKSQPEQRPTPPDQVEGDGTEDGKPVENPSG